MTDLSDLVGIVTGGTAGIGAAIARQACAAGAHVVVCGRRRASGDELINEIRRGGRSAEFVTADVRLFSDMEELCARTLDRRGRIDFVVANAGLTEQGPMADGDPEVWRDVIETNVLGTAHVVRAALPSMIERRSGHIVLMASVAGRENHPGEPIYMASKWAVVSLGRSLRRELLPHGIRVTLVEPGLTDTPLVHASPGAEAWLQAVEPLRPDDVAGAVIYALGQPPRVAVNEILIRPARQEA